MPGTLQRRQRASANMLANQTLLRRKPQTPQPSQSAAPCARHLMISGSVVFCQATLCISTSKWSTRPLGMPAAYYGTCSSLAATPSANAAFQAKILGAKRPRCATLLRARLRLLSSQSTLDHVNPAEARNLPRRPGVPGPFFSLLMMALCGLAAASTYEL